MDKSQLLNFINSKYLDSKKRLNGKLWKKDLEINKEIINYLQKLFSWTSSIVEQFYCLKNNVYSQPFCPICEKNLKFTDGQRGYGLTCSNSCQAKYTSQNRSIEEKNDISKKIKETFKISEKVKEGQIERLKKINNKTKEEKNETNNKRSNTLKDTIKDKKENMTEEEHKVWIEKKSKAGKIAWELHREEYIKNLKIIKIGAIPWNKGIKYNPQKKELLVQRQYETHKKNNTFITSTYEKEIEIILIDLYPCTKKQYRTIDYPFNCDYYIPCLNLYIELQINWTHGKEPFDISNLNHLDILEEWQQKSLESDYYKNAIEVWTIRDPNKRKIVLENKLNYLEIWKFKDKEDVKNQIERVIKNGIEV